MRMRTVEISVGAFMLAGILALVFLAVRVSGINAGAGSGETYTVYARFSNVGGLSDRAKVALAGVTIGRVTSVTVDSEYGEAVVALEIDASIDNLSADTGAQILTEGILGGRYVGLVPGAEEEYLTDGDTIYNTQGALVLEHLIGDFITRMGSS